MKASWMLIVIAALMLSACSRQPTCSVTSGDMGVPSAGCLAVDNGELLLVKIMGGTYGPPGGSVDSVMSLHNVPLSEKPGKRRVCR